MIESFEHSNDNPIISIVVSTVQTDKKFNPAINALVTNKTSKIIKIKFNEVYFVSHNKIQRDIHNGYYLSQPIEILPNVSKNITYNLSNVNDRDYRFNPMDLIITTFTIDGNKYSLGIRIGNAKDLTSTPILQPTTPNIKKKEPKWQLGCLVIFLIFVFYMVLAYLFRNYKGV
ncbi:MAG TPA: hypothetical protein PLL09_04615 [Flavobacterium sp.]|uniref:hypothetical protein n=1 Tax=unclassified Flavobacterium TaxID=196869 RepID=UPI0025C053B4|nr:MULTISPECIES: hypothetical protein [unclassified Flavobacterium]HRE77091.1 hypothetical protein [Flavobacterium sp.]